MKNEKNLSDIVNTTENTLIVYKKIASKSLKHDLDYLNGALEKSTPKDLIEKYFKSENEDGSFNYPYVRGIDDLFINTQSNVAKLEGEQYDNIAVLNWIKRKKKELEEVKENLIHNDKLYPTLKTDLTLTKVTRIFKLLKDCGWIDKSTTKSNFELALSGKETYTKPQIIFLKEKQCLAFLIEKLNLKKGHYSHIIETSEIFINTDKKPFKEIRKTTYQNTKDINNMKRNIDETLNT